MCKRRPAFWQTELSEFFMLYGIFHIFRKHVNILQNFFTALHIVHRGICHTQPFGGRGSHFLTGGGEVGNIIGNNIRGIKDFLDIFFCRMDIFHQAFNGFTDIAEFLPCILNQFVLLFYGSN